jgi:hypothetical protein
VKARRRAHVQQPIRRRGAHSNCGHRRELAQLLVSGVGTTQRGSRGSGRCERVKRPFLGGLAGAFLHGRPLRRRRAALAPVPRTRAGSGLNRGVPAARARDSAAVPTGKPDFRVACARRVSPSRLAFRGTVSVTAPSVTS